MMRRAVSLSGALAIAIACVILTPVIAAQGPGAAPSGAPAAQTWTPPRMPDGRPDLQGIWTNNTYTPLERPPQFAGKSVFTEQEAVAFFKAAASENYVSDPGVHYDPTEYGLDKWQHSGVKPSFRTSLIVDPPDGRLPPLTPEAKARLASQPPRGTHVRTRNPYERCATGYWGTGLLLKGGGRSEAGADLGTGADAEHQIVQTPGYVVIMAQSNNDLRIIPLDGRPHLSARTTRWFGDARGRWDGDTLVVETTNFNDVVRLRGHPVRNLRLVERFTRVDAETLQYAFTVEDPMTWTKPWTAEVHWAKAQGPIFEFACHEMNYGLLNVLRGELASAKKGSTK